MDSENIIWVCETARKYDIGDPKLEGAVHTYTRVGNAYSFRKKEPKVFMKERRGRACKASGTRKGRPTN